MTTHEPLYGRRGRAVFIKSFLLGLAVLVAGNAIGAGAMYLYLSKQKEPINSEPEIVAERFLYQLSSELGLTLEQRSKLMPAIREHYRKLRKIRDDVRPQIVSQLEQLDIDISNVLTLDQYNRWKIKIRAIPEIFPTFHGGPGRGRDGEPGREFGPGGPRGRDFEPGREFGTGGPRGRDSEPGREFGTGGTRGRDFEFGQGSAQGYRQPFGSGYRSPNSIPLMPVDPNAPLFFNWSWPENEFGRGFGPNGLQDPFQSPMTGGYRRSERPPQSPADPNAPQSFNRPWPESEFGREFGPNGLQDPFQSPMTGGYRRSERPPQSPADPNAPQSFNRPWPESVP